MCEIRIKLKLSRLRKYHTLYRRVKKAIKIFSNKYQSTPYYVEAGYIDNDFIQNKVTLILKF